MKLLLIDGDILRYRCGFAGQKTHYHMYHAKDVMTTTTPEGEVSYSISMGAQPASSHENAKDAKAWLDSQAEDAHMSFTRLPEVKLEPVANTLHSVKRVMEAICARYPEYHPCIYTSCPTEENWRYEFYPEYKANRQANRKPFYAYEIDQYMRKKWDVVDDPHLEADDLIAMQAYSNRAALSYENDMDYVVVSIDKDLLQIPGKHWNWVKEEETEVNGMEAMRLLAVQRIHGDSTDNIKGIPGWGEKTAQAHLEQAFFPDLEDIIEDAFRTAMGKTGELLFDTAYEARYHVRLTEALVTLPVNDEHRENLVARVKDAREAYEGFKERSEAASRPDGGTE